MNSNGNIGQPWYSTTNGSRWRYSKVIHIVDDTSATTTWCGMKKEKAATLFTHAYVIQKGLDHFERPNRKFCKKCMKHEGFGLILLREV